MASNGQQSGLARLQSILDSCIGDGVPGISAGISTSKGEQHYFHAGYKDILTKSPIDETTAFGIGSITKVFVAIVVLQLVEENKLSLEDQATSILGSELLAKIQHTSSVRIRDLLSHTGAIASWEDDLDWIKDGRGKTIQPEKIWTKEETLQYVKPDASMGLEVGKYHYANTNYTILGLVVERVTRNTAENEIRRRILEPLDMVNTYIEGFERPLADRTPHRYHWATDTFFDLAGISPYFSSVRGKLIDVTGTNLSVSWMAGGMISNPGDLLKLAVALQEGKLLTPVSLTMLMEWQDADEEKDIGNGIFRLRHANTSGIWIGHNGGVLGFSSALWLDVNGSCAVSILSNVGASHSGDVAWRAAHVALRTDFLKIAVNLPVP